MGVETADLVQLALALLAMTTLFLLAYALPERISVAVLVVLIPFQPIDSRFGTLNVMLAYCVGLALMLKAPRFKLPLLGPIALIGFAYLLSLSQVHPATYVQHGIFVMSLGAGLMLFWVVYNHVADSGDPRVLHPALAWMNGLVCLYCLIQAVAGPGEKFALLDWEYLAMPRNRGGDDPRLAGPFAAPGMTAEFFLVMIFLWAHELTRKPRWPMRVALAGLVAANLVFLLMTGNRGAFLLLVLAFPAFLYLFRKELGVLRAARTFVFAALLLAGTSALVLSYSEFSVIYERLAETEIESGVPDTRTEAWAVAVEGIAERPLLGHGPRLRLIDDHIVRYPAHQFLDYPHNLYLFLLYTVGIVGLAAFLTFFAGLVWRLLRAARTAVTADERGLAKLFLLLLALILLDQIKIEFLRIANTDFQQYLFCMFAVFLAAADLAVARAAASARAPSAPRPAALGHGALARTRAPPIGTG